MSERFFYEKRDNGYECFGIETDAAAVSVWRIGDGPSSGGVELHTANVDGKACRFLSGRSCTHDGSTLLYDEAVRRWWIDLERVQSGDPIPWMRGKAQSLLRMMQEPT